MAVPRPQPFGHLLKRFRLAAGLTQETLADRANMSARGVSDLERGTRRAPYRDTIDRLAAALRLTDAERAHLAAAAERLSGAAPSSPPRPAPLRRESAPPPLVGRMHELARLDRFLAGDEAPLLLLAGEPGIGKSRLLRETAARAREQGWTVLMGGCTRRDGQEPYAPLVGALARQMAERSREALRADLQDCAWLVRLLPELAESALLPMPQWALAPDQERRLMFAAVGRYLANVAGPAGTLLLLDDLQWAGVDALDLLAALVHADPSAPLRVLGAYRATEVRPADALGMLLADLAREELVGRLDVGPLAPGEASALVERLLMANSSTAHALAAPSEAATRLAERAGGVPYFLVSGARALAAGATEIPWDVEQSIHQRVALLPVAAGELLGVVAVANQQVEHALLGLVAARLGQAEPVTLAALEATVNARLLVEGSGSRYRFGHDLIGEVVAADLGATRRSLLHRYLAEAMEARLAPEQDIPQAAELAWHFIQAGEEARALPYAVLAGDHAETVYAYEEAERHYRTALNLARTLGDAVRHADLSLKLGKLLWQHHHDRNDSALEILEDAARRFQALSDREGELQAVAAILHIYADRGQAREGVARAEQLLTAMGDSADHATTPGLAALYLGLANLYFMTSRYQDLLAAAERARDLAQAARDDELLASALSYYALAIWNTRSADEALPAFFEIIPVVEHLHSAPQLLRLTNYVAEALLYRGEFTRGLPYQDRALEVVERYIGDPARSAFELGNRGNYAYYMGDWARARADCERAAVLMRQADPSGVATRSAYPHIWLGKLDLAQGRWLEGEHHLAHALAIASPPGDMQALRHAQSVLAERDLLAGHAREALARLQPLLDRPGLQEPNVTMRLLPLVAWATVSLDTEAADIAVQTALTRAEATKAGIALVDARRIQAMLLIQQGRWQEAEASLDDTIAQCRAMPYPYAEAKALYFSGQLCIAQGELELAREVYQAALAILDRLGEYLYRPVIAAALAALPAEPVPANRASVRNGSNRKARPLPVSHP